MAESLNQSRDFVRPRRIHEFLAFYLSAIWLLPDIRLPFGVFEGIPFYVVLTPLVLVFLGRRAVQSAAVLALALFACEFCKNFQSGYHETLKAVLGLIALSLLLPTIYYSFTAVLRCPPKFVGNWLAFTLFLELAAIVFGIVFGLLGATHSNYKNYFLPIRSYSGFFTEPSHVAMMISPFLIMAIFDFGTYRRYLGTTGTISLLGIALLCSSATEFAAMAIGMAALIGKQTTQGRFLNLIVAVTVTVLVAVAALSVHQIAWRILGVLMPKNTLAMADNNAISMLAFFKGFEMARYTLLHVPLGVAFLDMSALSKNAEISHVSILMSQLNSSDGSSILFKGVCEFGYLFVAFAGYAIVKTVAHVGRYARKDAYAIQNLVFLASEITLLALFIRSASYFGGVTAIAITLLIFLRPSFILAPRAKLRRAPSPDGPLRAAVDSGFPQ